jgi:conjugative relaxase-like TrwC/TraI family protein
MSMSIKKITIGAGYAQYLNSSIEDSAMAVNDLEGAAHYYTAPGTPAGVWMGKGTDAMGQKAGAHATAEQTSLMLDQLRNPATGQALLRIPNRNGANASARDKKSEGKAASATMPVNGPDTVSGWDLTFAAPKSASVLWALGDDRTRKQVQLAHQKAVKESLDWFEENLAATRQGRGGVLRTKVKGVSAIRFDHWDNREGEPHLHSHLTLSNAVVRPDGKTAALDGRAVYAWGVAMGKRYNQILMDSLHSSLGVNWVMREESMLGTTGTVWDIEGMDPDLIRSFSQRTADTNRRLAELVARERDAGHEPGYARLAELRAKAWQATRKPKEKTAEPLKDKRRAWAQTARDMGHDPVAETRSVQGRGEDVTNQRAITGKEETLAALAALAGSGLEDRGVDLVEAEAAGKRTTVSRANIDSAAYDLLAGVRFSSAQAMDESVTAVREKVMERLVPLQENRYRLPDSLKDNPLAGIGGVAVVDADPLTAKYATPRLMDAEETFMSLSRETIRELDDEQRTRIRESLENYSTNVATHRLDPDQAKAAEELLTTTTRTAGLVGAAGTGKTTTLRAVLHVEEETGIGGKILGISPSARGAAELEASLEQPTTTVASIITEARVHAAAGRLARLGHRLRAETDPTRRARLASLYAQALVAKDKLTIPEGGTVIVDEASMISTIDAASLIEMCRERNARLLMVGDPQQLESPGEGGGTLAWAERAGLTTEITTTHRFNDPHEAEVADMVRKGVRNPDGTYAAIDEYERMGRITAGPDAGERIFADTVADLIGGVDATIAAASVTEATTLNRRIGEALQARGLVDADPSRRLRLGDGTSAGAGDLVTTRKIDKDLVTSLGDYVRNGDQWRVLAVENATARLGRLGDQAQVSITADWLELNASGGYASTLIRTQGRTSTVSRQLIGLGGTPNRGNFYVGATRGRELNQIYVETPDVSAMKAEGGGDTTLKTWRSWKRTLLENLGRREWNGPGPKPDSPHWYTDADLDPTGLDLAKQTLNQVMDNSADTRLAHEVKADYDKASHSLERLLAERDGFETRKHENGLTSLLEARFDAGYVDEIRNGDSWDGLVQMWARAESTDPDAARAAVVERVRASTAMRSEPGMLFDLEHAPDPGRILLDRLTDVAANGTGRDAQARKEPEARTGWDDLLDQNRIHLEEALDRFVQTQRGEGRQPWVAKLGRAPEAGSEEGRKWDRLVKDVALYRARHRETRDANPLGPAVPATTAAGRLRNAERLRLLDRIRDTRTPGRHPSWTRQWEPTALDRSSYERITAANAAAWQRIRTHEGETLSAWAEKEPRQAEGLLEAGLLIRTPEGLRDRFETQDLLPATDARNNIVALVPRDGTQAPATGIWEPSEMMWGTDRASVNLLKAGAQAELHPTPGQAEAAAATTEQGERRVAVAVTEPGSHQLDMLRHLQGGEIRRPLIASSDPAYLQETWQGLSPNERRTAQVRDEAGTQALWQRMMLLEASGAATPEKARERQEERVVARMDPACQQEARQWAMRNTEAAPRREAEERETKPLRQIQQEAGMEENGVEAARVETAEGYSGIE